MREEWEVVSLPQFNPSLNAVDVHMKHTSFEKMKIGKKRPYLPTFTICCYNVSTTFFNEIYGHNYAQLFSSTCNDIA